MCARAGGHQRAFLVCAKSALIRCTLHSKLHCYTTYCDVRTRDQHLQKGHTRTQGPYDAFSLHRPATAAARRLSTRVLRGDWGGGKVLVKGEGGLCMSAHGRQAGACCRLPHRRASTRATVRSRRQADRRGASPARPAVARPECSSRSSSSSCQRESRVLRVEKGRAGTGGRGTGAHQPAASTALHCTWTTECTVQQPAAAAAYKHTRRGGGWARGTDGMAMIGVAGSVAEWRRW